MAFAVRSLLSRTANVALRSRPMSTVLLSQGKLDLVRANLAAHFDKYDEVSTSTFAMMVKSSAAGKFKIKDTEVDALIASIDENGDGVIQVEEFEHFLKDANFASGIIGEACTSMVGLEKIEKVRDVMAAQFETYEEVSTSTFAMMIKAKSAGKFEISDAEVNALIAMIDENGDEMIQVEEFEHFLRHAELEEGLVLEGPST